MLKSFDEDCGVPPEGNQLYHLDNRSTGHETHSYQENFRKIFLPRGSAHAKCGPQPYYYFASESGAVPSWMINQITRKNGRVGTE